MIDRRTAMRKTGWAALLTAAPARAVNRTVGHGLPPLGINLYMLAEDYRRDIDATLRAVAAIGYREVETNFDVYPPDRIRAALDRSGLTCANIILQASPLTPGGRGMTLATDAATLATAVRAVGAGHVTCSLFPLPPGVEMRPQAGETIPHMLARVTSRMTRADWQRNAAFFNAKGAELARHGVRIAYHNHNPEFAPIGESSGMAIMLEETDPALVDFEMDAGWVVAAGHDPVELLRAYPGRFRFMHVKDIAAGNVPNTVISAATIEAGAGIVDWSRVLRAAMANGVRHFAVEQEPPQIPPLNAARTSFAYLTRLRF